MTSEMFETLNPKRQINKRTHLSVYMTFVPVESFIRDRKKNKLNYNTKIGIRYSIGECVKQLNV